MSEIKTRQVTAQKDKRSGFYILRWRNRFGQRREQRTEIPATQKNYKRALVAAQDKQRELVTGKGFELVPWLEFQIRYEREYLDELGGAHQRKWKAAVKRVDEFLNPVFVNDLDSRRLSQLGVLLKSATYGKGENEKPVSQGTIDGYFRSILGALSWAAEMQIIQSVPVFRVSKQKSRKARVGKRSKGRAITGEEHERMKEAAREVRKDAGDAETWIKILDHLYLSGLRLEEQMALSWDWSDPFAVSIDCKYPRYVIEGDAQKSGKSELLPIAPDYVELLRKTPMVQREGKVLRWSFATSTTTRIISKIGKTANVKVNSQGKMASAHDYRRTFGTRWASKLAPADLQRLMRHASINTTMDYYVNLPSDELGARLWATVEPETETAK